MNLLLRGCRRTSTFFFHPAQPGQFRVKALTFLLSDENRQLFACKALRDPEQRRSGVLNHPFYIRHQVAVWCEIEQLLVALAFCFHCLASRCQFLVLRAGLRQLAVVLPSWSGFLADSFDRLHLFRNQDLSPDCTFYRQRAHLIYDKNSVGVATCLR